MQFPAAAIHNDTHAELVRIVDRLSAELPGIPKKKSSTENFLEPSVYEGRYGGALLTVLYSMLPPAALSTFTDRMRAEVRRFNLPIRATQGGQSLCLNDVRAFKGRALRYFALELGMSPTEVFTFGDSAHAGGNDETLVRGPRGHAVGTRTRADPEARATKEKFGRGTASVLASLDPRVVPAIATDYDGTLTPVDSDRMLPEVCRQLVRYINAGVPIAVITGRGPSAVDLVIRPLLAAGADPRLADRIIFALYNGAIMLRPQELEGHSELTPTGARWKPGRPTN